MRVVGEGEGDEMRSNDCVHELKLYCDLLVVTLWSLHCVCTFPGEVPT